MYKQRRFATKTENRVKEGHNAQQILHLRQNIGTHFKNLLDTYIYVSHQQHIFDTYVHII